METLRSEIGKALEKITGLKKNIAIDLTGEFEILELLSKDFKKVYTVVQGMEKLRELQSKFNDFGIRNVGIIVSEKFPEFNFRFNLVISFKSLNKADFEHLKEISELILLIGDGNLVEIVKAEKLN